MNAFKVLEINQNSVFRIILSTKTLEGSTKTNYSFLGIYRSGNKQIAVIFSINKFTNLR